MEEKNLNGSEKLAQRDISPDDDSATVGDVSVDKEETLEAVTSQPQSKDSKSLTDSSEDPPDDDSIPADAAPTETDEKDGNPGSASMPSEDHSAPPAESAGESENETVDPYETIVSSDQMESVNDNDVEDSETAAGIEMEADENGIDSQADKAAFIKDTDDPGSAELPDENSGVPEAESAPAETAGEDVTDDGAIEGIRQPSEEQRAFEEMDHTGKTEDNGAEGDPSALNQTESETAGADDDTDDPAQEATIESPAKKTPALKVAVSIVIIAAAFSGFFFFDNRLKPKRTPEKASKFSQSREIGGKRISKKKTIRPLAPRINSVYTAKIEAVTALRDSLLLKQEEVIRLKKHYRDGIEELEKEIWDESRKRQCKTFFQAMENDNIAFTLRTIQRKQAYIQQLEKPSKWIHQACEELLYIKRRTLVDLEVVEIAAGIDMNQHVQRIDVAVQKYQPDADKLAPEMANPQLEPLETIWERIQEKTQQYASTRVHSKNRIISEQICAGDFNRLTELSEISSQTAKCISEVQASDLFLNNVTEISPGAARQLINWRGSWICLNGVRALSPRAAHYLFQWNGNWISLNGLSEFPVEIGEALLQWEGRQLELMGLEYIEDFPEKIAFEYLARWERAGGKLFVPESVRKKINEIHTKSI